ncbi:hypothetical protein L1O59_002861 [Salmonella enterica]|nr:hypothetical protein [Salmonella enterica]ECD6161843.1 hypothetical protein [Salmonella enterica subsp. enterica]ECU7993358.1 hypothetical protein [Salmonella enterica subsp. enterica serovar Toucra]EAP9509383.1 hypothetical protein [Salmonella enterica]EAW3044400.1 hypothetical protein [Salmonella enterica]
MSVEQTGFREIFNFEHHLTSEGRFFIGPYEITVSKELIGGDFARSKRLIFSNTFDSSGFKRSVKEEPSSSGTWSVTAVVAEHEKLDQASELFPDAPWGNGAYDLSVILSLLSGRHTLVGNGVEPYLPVSPGYSITSKNFFRANPVVDWELLPGLRKAKVGEAMEAVLLAMTNSNVGVKIAMGSAALDGLYTRWYSDSGSNPYTKKVKEEVKAASEKFKEHLEKAGVNQNLINDIMPRLLNVANESALAKLAAFLKAGSMYPEIPDEETLKRLKWLNVLRNSVAHSGSIRLDIAESPEASLRVAGAVALLLQDICRIYIAKYLLKIEDYGVAKAQQAVMDFFQYGTYKGQDILTEDHETYQQRLIDHYEEFGSLDL